jgi:hypothetical protein
MSNPNKKEGRRTKAEGACVVGILVVDVGDEIVSFASTINANKFSVCCISHKSRGRLEMGPQEMLLHKLVQWATSSTTNGLDTVYQCPFLVNLKFEQLQSKCLASKVYLKQQCQIREKEKADEQRQKARALLGFLLLMLVKRLSVVTVLLMLRR